MVTALTVPELEVPELEVPALAALEPDDAAEVLAALAACAVAEALFAAVVVVLVDVVVVPVAVTTVEAPVDDVLAVVAVPSSSLRALVRVAARSAVVRVAAVDVPRLPSPYTAPHETTSTVRAIAPTRRRMTRTRRARARSRRRSSADWARRGGVRSEVMEAVCDPLLTASCALPESRLSARQRASRRCSTCPPEAIITSLVSSGAKIPWPMTPAVASRRAASASGSSNGAR